LKEEVLVHTLWTARFGRGYGPVVIRWTEWMINQWRRESASFSTTFFHSWKER
jgi:hypothetical protein